LQIPWESRCLETKRSLIQQIDRPHVVYLILGLAARWWATKKAGTCLN